MNIGQDEEDWTRMLNESEKALERIRLLMTEESEEPPIVETEGEKEDLEEGLVSDSLETSTEDKQDPTENHPCEDELTPVRSFCKSEIWDRDPLYVKLLIWIIAQVDENGEVMTTCSKIQEDLSYFSNRKKTVPTLKQTRIILEWLQVQGYISKTQVRGKTRAYIGTQITLNYRAFQNLRGKDRDTSQTENSGTQPGQSQAQIDNEAIQGST